MATGAQTWSTAAASNNSADSNVNWAEGMAPSAVNDSARAEMASAAMWISDNSGVLATTGTSAAFTVTTKQVSTANTNGYTVAVKFHSDCAAAATLARDTAPAAVLQLISGTNCSTADFKSGSVHRFRYDSGSTGWVAFGAAALGSSAVNTDNIAASAVTYAKIQNETAGTILGNGSGGAAAPAELTIGTGLTATSNSITAPAFPPTSAFKNLSIKTATSTTIDCRADFVTLATSGSSSFASVPCSGTINMASTGVVNGIDTGALANSTIYAIYAIAASATSTSGGFLASTSFTTPLMPSGYTVKARVGAQITTTTTATAGLYMIYQYGRRAQYRVDGTLTTHYPLMDGGAKGNPTTGPTLTGVSVAAFVPTTASEIGVIGQTVNGVVIVSPSTFTGTLNSTTNPPPLAIIADSANSHTVVGSLLLEGTSIFWASSVAASGLWCTGWVDNI